MIADKLRALAERLNNVHRLAGDELRQLANEVAAVERTNARLKQEIKDMEYDARDIAAEAGWKHRQGDEYGSY
jgi:uncharacterized protein (UPF0335 family)